MATSKFEIRYALRSVDLSGKKVIYRLNFRTDSFESFSSYYRYLRYGAVSRVSLIRSLRMGEIVLPFSKKTQRIKGVSKRLFNNWEANMFDLF